MQFGRRVIACDRPEARHGLAIAALFECVDGCELRIERFVRTQDHDRLCLAQQGCDLCILLGFKRCRNTFQLFGIRSFEHRAGSA